MVHYGFNLGSPAANSAPERTDGRYATRLAGLNARSIGVRARQPKAPLKSHLKWLCRPRIAMQR